MIHPQGMFSVMASGIIPEMLCDINYGFFNDLLIHDSIRALLREVVFPRTQLRLQPQPAHQSLPEFDSIILLPFSLTVFLLPDITPFHNS